MPKLFETTIADIKALKDVELTMLMQCLISNELAANGLPRTDSKVCFDINVPDGGADGIVALSTPGVIRTDHIPARDVVFQAKSGTLRPEQFARELIEKKSRGKRLKPRVNEMLDKHGAYVLFYGKSCGNKNDRIKEMGDTIRRLRPSSKPPTISIIDCNEIVNWCDQHLAASVQVAHFTGKTSLASGFMTWTEWSRYTDAFGNEFIQSGHTKEHIARIRIAFLTSPQSKNREPLRLIGQSGLGKTRIALEAFRPPTDTFDDGDQVVLSDSVAYTTAHGGLPSIIRDLRRQNVSGTLVIDNCDRALHELLRREVMHADSLLTLLTIDHGVRNAPLHPGEFLVEKASVETLFKIVEAEHPKLGPHELDMIARFSDGYPEIAARLSDAPLEQQLTFKPNLQQTLVDNLVWGRDTPDAKKLEVISALALFTDVGFDGRDKDEKTFIASRICETSLKDFQSAAASFMPRILDRIGDYVRVSPLPLAIRLAEQWYRETDQATTLALFSDESIPARLAEARVQRFAELGELGEAEGIARRLMDPTAPFGRAEVLNTEQGSRVFRSLSEVDPEAAATTLLREFGSWSVDDLQTRLRPGRRHIVWALEKIVFHREHFLRGMRMLARLAVGENGKIGNNATREYIGHFQVQLAGTEADYGARIAAVDELLALEDERFTRLAIRALGRAVIDSTGRTLGAERQRGRVLEDFQPKTYGEIHAYFTDALVRLARFGQRDDALGELARKRISRAIRFVVRFKPAAIDGALRTVTASYTRAWPDAVEAIESTIRYDEKRLPEETVALVRSWLDLLRPTSLAERIRLTISLAPYGNVVEQEDGSYLNLSEERAAVFADEVLKDDEQLHYVVKQISTGEQRQSFAFGRRIGEVIEPGRFQSFAAVALTALAHAECPNQSLMVGYLVGLSARDREAAQSAIRYSFSIPATARYAAEFTAVTAPDENDMLALLPLLDQGIVTAASFGTFAFRYAVAKLSPDFVAGYFKRLLAFGVPGAQAALPILSMYLYGDDGTKWRACREVMRQLVLTPGLFQAAEKQQLEHHSLEQTIKKILREPTEDTAFVKSLAHEIVRICKLPKFNFGAYNIMKPVALELLTSAQKTSWPIFRKALADGGGMTRFHLLHVFEEHVMGRGPKTALLLLPNDELERWMQRAPAFAPLILARHVPLFADEPDAVKVSPIIERVLAKFGADENVLSEMSANLESFSNVGSMVPAYETRLAFVRLLMDHRVPEVATWAQKYAASLETRVKSLKKRDEEWSKGILARLPFDDT